MIAYHLCGNDLLCGARNTDYDKNNVSPRVDLREITYHL